MTLFTFNIIKILVFSSIAAFITFLFSPFLIGLLNKLKFWKKEAREKTITGESASVFNNLHKERETTVPRGGGLIVWITVLFLTFLFFLLSYLPDPWWFKNLNFLSRHETWLPLFTLAAASIVGLVDDALTVYGKGKYIGGGMGFKRRLLIVSLIGLIGGLWFYFQLNWTTIHIPLLFNFPQGIDWTVGLWIIPIFIIVMVASWAGGVIDGLDGLSGGVFASIFGAFMIIAFAQGKTDLATFCALIVGSLFAFLWFNIPPAKFYMGETGILGLTSTMAVVAFLTDSIAVLPIIAGLLVIEVGSILIQLWSKKFRHKKIWLSTPIHHHLEAKGWTSQQITMRFWIIAIVLAGLGTAIRLLD
jgi:phospho-N-acetylmuramoyl-pentapeptide-transferase